MTKDRKFKNFILSLTIAVATLLYIPLSKMFYLINGIREISHPPSLYDYLSLLVYLAVFSQLGKYAHDKNFMRGCYYICGVYISNFFAELSEPIITYSIFNIISIILTILGILSWVSCLKNEAH